jgi:endonuclease YncB( thermonuclease family)
MPAIIVCEAPWVIDGDSVRCSNVGEIRLLGIDAPDYRDSPPCRGHYGDHVCDDGAAKAAKRNLVALVSRNRAAVTLLPVTTDRYGRTVAEMCAGGVDLSCWQMRAGVARYIVKYDTGGQIARACKR